MKIGLNAAMELIKDNVNIDADFRIEKIYIDYPSWIDYTICVYPREGMSYQLLSVGDVDKANKKELTLNDVQRYIDDINKRGG